MVGGIIVVSNIISIIQLPEVFLYSFKIFITSFFKHNLHIKM